MSTVIDTPSGIQFFRLLQMRGSLSIQIKTGLPHSQGSVWKLAKETYGLTGSMESVHKDLCLMVEQVQELRGKGFEVVSLRELACALGLNDDGTEGVRLLADERGQALVESGEVPTI